MTGGIDPTSDRAAYRQIADHLREDILEGRLAEGDQLPSERDLIETYGAARGTVRQAVALLRSDGLIEVEHGRGAFVRRRPPMRRLSSDRFQRRLRKEGKAAFLAETEAEGRVPQVEVLEVGPSQAPRQVAELLELDFGDPVLVRRRRYFADGQPIELATSYLPLELVEGTRIAEVNPGPGGIYARLEEMGHELDHFTEDVTGRMPLPEETRALRLRPGVPVLLLVRTAYDTRRRARRGLRHRHRRGPLRPLVRPTGSVAKGRAAGISEPCDEDLHVSRFRCWQRRRPRPKAGAPCSERRRGRAQAWWRCCVRRVGTRRCGGPRPAATTPADPLTVLRAHGRLRTCSSTSISQPALEPRPLGLRHRQRQRPQVGPCTARSRLDGFEHLL